MWHCRPQTIGGGGNISKRSEDAFRARHNTVTNPLRKQTTLQCPHAYIHAQSGDGVFIVPPHTHFSASPVVKGVGVTLTQFYHGGSHHHSDHFLSPTECDRTSRLTAGSSLKHTHHLNHREVKNNTQNTQ